MMAIPDKDPCPNCKTVGTVKYILYDARSIPVGYVCDAPGCEESKKRKYHPEIFDNPSYYADEPIEPEEYY